MLVTNGPKTISELRLFFAQLRMLVGGAASSAATEAQKMVSEKVAAFVEAHGALMTALATGSSFSAAAVRAYAPYRRCVRVNSRRLGS